MNVNGLKKAKWQQPAANGKLLCTLCPRRCTIGEGQKGFCFVRENIGGTLYSTGYGRPTGFAIDPIEKKPLNHFYPGSEILSFGTAGCNLGCKFCQNWSMSKSQIDQLNSLTVSPEDVVKLAKRNKADSIAFTYNDPTIFGEYVIDISKIARREGIKTVMVTAGYIDKEARKEVYEFIDAANVDLKAFSENFYRKLTFSHLDDVLSTLIWLKNETDVWLEITNLIIPDENDSPDEIKKMISWILENLGTEVPLHFTAFHPDFRMRDKFPTPASVLKSARLTAIHSGIKYCYTGNIYDPEGSSTHCPNCGKLLIDRSGYTIGKINLSGNVCKFCGAKIAGRFIK